MAAVEQPAVSTTGNKESKLSSSNGVDHNINAAQSLKQRMSAASAPDTGPPAPPNGQNSGHERNGGTGYPGQYPGYYGYGQGPPPPKGAPAGPGGPYPGAPAHTSGGPTPTLNSLLQDRGQRPGFPPAGYEGAPPGGPPPPGPGGPPPQGYPGWGGYQGHPQYRGQVGHDVDQSGHNTTTTAH